MMMNQEIPAPVILICSEIISNRESHATLDRLFLYANASGDAPLNLSKPAKATEWLRNTNKDKSRDPLNVLGKIIENYIEMPLDPENELHVDLLNNRTRILDVLKQFNLTYLTGGRIIGGLGAPSQNLANLIKQFDFESIELEFERALNNVQHSPREAVSAASNILEAFCKIYIEMEGLPSPQKQDLKSIWIVVRKDLGFDAKELEDRDLQQILTGLISITEGIGALRTHASSAHGSGSKRYKIEPRHARLAVHSAHSVTMFCIETWKKKRST